MATVDPSPPPPHPSTSSTPHDASPSPAPSSSYQSAGPHATLFRLGLQPLIVHFHSHGNGYMDPATLDQFDTKILKRIIRDTVSNPDVRTQLGTDRNVWLDLRDLFYAGTACLSGLCCQPYVNPTNTHTQQQQPIEDDLDASAVEGQPTPEEVASSALIVKNYPLLTKDLARLITLASIARNILVAGPSAQDLAASRSVRIEDSVFALISLCVRVTGRGFDSGGNGNGTKDDERKWQGVVNEFKRLLATCLQVLNNLVAQNERRKLMLWVSLFDSPAEESEGDGNGELGGGGWNLDRRLIEGLRDDPVVNGSWAEGEGREEVEMEVGRDGVPKVIRRFQDGLMAHMKRLEERRMLTGRTVNNLASTNTHLRESETPTLDKEQLSSSPFLLYIGKVGMDIKKELLDAGRPAGATEIAAECKRRWQTMSREEQKNWHEYYTQLLASYRDEVEARDPAVEGMNVASEAVKHDSSAVGLAQTIEQVQSDLRALQLAYPDKADLSEAANESVKDIPQGLSKNYWNWLVGLDKKQTMPGNGDGPVQRPIRADNTAPTAEDYRVTYSAKYGAAILQQGKEDLLRRLEPDRLRTSRSRRARTRSPPPPPPSTTPLPPRSGSQPVPEPPDAPLCLASEDDVDSREPLSAASAASSEEDGSEYDDPVPGDDGRGLLTDVPLILGPTEIEVLPMIVQSGIVAPLPGQPGYGETFEENEALRSMHALRCHLLLAQDNGRNLVRELLIFVAAWDLREEELYFQLMTQVLEAVLVNGLLPFAYHAFRESKDIISPAQAVIMKLLTHIFRRRQASSPANKGLAIFPRSNHSSPASTPPPAGREGSYPHRPDIHVVSHLLTEFRRHIIPQTCALIFLQGQIRAGLVSPEEFPLNLWDMERMYEGVYQYLEFFAILTEREEWKQMMGEWGVAFELVTLLEELEGGVARGTARGRVDAQGRGYRSQREAYEQAQAQQQYEEAQAQAVNEMSTPAPAPVSVERPYDPQYANATPSLLHHPTSTPQQTLPPPPPPPPPLEDEPSDFEWRNLKKLAVLVLSSLVWKSPQVQAQLGAAGPLDDPHGPTRGRGIRALLNCCKVDDYNPYIREHAIMALRFALEGSEENQDVVRSLEKVGMDPANEPTLGAGGTATLRQQYHSTHHQPQSQYQEYAQAGPSSALVDTYTGAGAEQSGVVNTITDAGRATITTATGVKVEVPREVLDLNGYETFVDGRGQVQLKKKGLGGGRVEVGVAVERLGRGGEEFDEEVDFM